MRILLALAAIASPLALAAQQPAANTPWDYEGPRGSLVWNKLDPAYNVCEKGRAQSPIDIRGAHLNKKLAPIEFHYRGGGVTLENDGHTVLVRVHPGSYMIANGARYELRTITFHHPGETPVNGKLTEMEAHLIHEGADGKIAIIAVRLAAQRGDPNSFLASLWPQLPVKPGDKATVAEMVNAAGLLPDDRGYWTYEGSLTTPPCTEGVQWFVMENEVPVSREQFIRFSQLFRVNTRPVQDTRGRRIEANQ